MLIIRTLIVVIIVSLTVNVSVTMAKEKAVTASAKINKTKEARKTAIKKEIQKRSEIEQRRVERFQSLPEDIKLKIKDRKMAILESRKEIRGMKPENRAELQAMIQRWFSSLPLEKQSEIQIRIEGVSSVKNYRKQLREREARELIAKEKAKADKKAAIEKSKKLAKEKAKAKFQKNKNPVLNKKLKSKVDINIKKDDKAVKTEVPKDSELKKPVTPVPTKK